MVTSPHPESSAQSVAQLEAWLASVTRGSRRRGRIELISSAKRVVKPLVMAQRYFTKARQIGLAAATRIVIDRARARLRRGRR